MKQKRRLFLARAAMTLLLTLLIPGGLWAAQTPVSLSDDGAGGWFINMPAKGTATSVANAAVLTLTADDISAGKIPFKLYDDGGKDGNYSQSYNGYLLITVPSRYIITMNGTQVGESTSWDYLYVYDGDNTSAKRSGPFGGSDNQSHVNVTSSTNTVLVSFYSDGSNEGAGMDITVDITDTYNLNIGSVFAAPYIPFTGSVIDMNPAVTTCNNITLTKDTHYTVTTSPSPVKEIGDYEMTITAIDPYYGTLNANFAVTANLEGDGTEAHPYHISNITEYNLFVSYINGGITPYAEDGKNFKLTANIGSDLEPVTAMVGRVTGSTQVKAFTGVLDGDGHTLTVDLSDTGNQGVAPFRYISTATIKNLTVAGTIASNSYHTSGLVGFAAGTNLIDNCTVTATLNLSSDYAGGIIGHGLESVTTIKDCVFAGTIKGIDTGHYNIGGIWGWSHTATPILQNCLEKGSYPSWVNSFHPIGLQGNSGTITDCYYLNPQKNSPSNPCAVSGAYRVFTDLPDGKITKYQQLVDGNNYYIDGNATITGVNETYDYNNGLAIDISYALNFKDAALTAATDYTAIITDSNSQDVTGNVTAIGRYTLTFTGTGDYRGTQTKDFAVVGLLSGEGTAESPYLINNNDDWGIFATNVTNGMTYSGKYVQMTDDITVTTMAGSSQACSFQGTFLGTAGKTMTVNLTGTADNCAPFGYIKGATIKDLTVAGTITTGYKFGASIAVHNYGTTHIQNCVSTVVITSTFEESADGTHAGFVALNEGSSYLYFNDCVFAGKLLGANAYANGGFVGYNGGYYIYFTDCLFAPSEITMSTSSSATFHRNGSSSFTRTYYLTQFGNAQGLAVTTTPPADNVYKAVVAADANTYYAACTITGLDDIYSYTGSAVAVNPVVKLGSNITLTKNTDYTVTFKNSSDETVAPEALIETGNYTITITGTGNYAGSCTIAFQILTGENIGGYFFETGTDDEGTYYKIATATDFDNLAACVKGTDNVTAGKRFKQTANITVSSMIGTNQNRSFQGVYDGQGNTLTLDITATQNIAAPFRYIKGATIKNITIAGAINNSGKQNGGVAGYSYGDVTIANCTVSTSITSSFNGDASNGGFIAHIQTGNVTFNNCAFTGRLLGESANSSAGFVGWRDNTSIVITFNNCLVAPAEITMGVLNSATFNRNKTDNNIYTNSFYLTSFGEVQGAKVVTVAPASGVYKAVVAADANNYFALCDVTGVESVYLHTGSAIAVEPVVKLCSETLTAATDYTVTFKNSSDETVAPEALIENGHYTVTVAGIGSFAGSETFNFRILNGENLDGYVFETATDDEGSYYVIADKSDFNRFRAYVNSGHNAEGKRFKQTANIALTEEHTPIGNGSNKFYGTYDGGNNTISGLVINNPNGEYQGLFGYISSATIKNVVLDNCDITAKKWVGGIVGYAYNSSHISHCTVSGALTTAAGVEGFDQGGIVGYGNYVDNCVNLASVTGNGTYSRCYGGVAGYANNTISNCFNLGAVTGGTSNMGSIVGDKGGSLSNNYRHISTIGGVGAYNVPTSSDQSGVVAVYAITIGNASTHLTTEPEFEYNGSRYYKNNIELALSYDLPDGKVFDQYAVTNATLTNAYVIDATHVLTNVTDDVTITGSHTDKMNIASGSTTVHVGILPYTGDVITVAPIVERLGVTLVQGTDYTFTTDPAVVQAVGEYTLTITGQGEYMGIKQVTFYVKDANIIKNAEEWADFAANVNAGTGNDGYYKLADDFDNTESAVTATVGTQEHPFTGLFDGNGKTLTVNINETSTQGTAPFREIAGATIRNLTVNGSVTGTTHAAGLVGFTRSGVNYIDNCVVNTNVNGSTGSNRHIGGVVGHGIQSTVNISNTIYTGVLTNSQNYAGGLLGWSDGNKLNITHCLVTASKSGSGKFHPIAIMNEGSVMDVTVDGAFYTNDPTLTDAKYIAATGTKVYAGAQTAFCKKEWTLNETDYYSKETAVIGNVDNTIEYTGDVITVSPTVSYEGTALTADTDFTFATDPATVQEKGEYTLTITGKGNYAGTQSMKFHVVAGVLDGEGTEANPYLIASDADWNKFAGNINSGDYNYSGQFVQMTNDITVSTMAGNSETHSFQGTFLGTAGKTMTVNLTGTADNCAPFGYIKGATIKDLTVAGTITTGYKFGASIAVHNYGTTHIQNCVSTVVITSTFEESKDGTHGGLVALNESSAKLYFNDCVFAGKLLGANAYANGGFVGWTNGNIYYTDCLFAPAETTMSTTNSCTFNRNGRNSLTRAYYLTAFGSTQGTIAYTSENVPAEGLFGQITATDGNTYYVQGSVGNINDSYAYTGSVISINPTFAISGEESVSFVKDTDFEVAITKDGNPVAEVNEIGDYVFTISAKDGGKCKGSTTKNVNVYGSVPTNFAWSEVTASTATLTWSDNVATNWTVEFSDNSEFTTLIESRDVTAKTVTFEDLTAETDYYARVQAVYGENRSEWSSTSIIQPSTKQIVGSGTATSTVLPFHLWYHHNLTQQIYTPAELGSKAGSILSIDFFRTDNDECKNSIEIYLVQTSKNSFDSGTDWIPVTAADKVFGGKVDFSSNAWTTITLDAPFDYNGTSNLALIVYDPNVSGDNYGTRYFRVFSGESNQSIQYNSDSTDPTIAPTVSGNRSSNKNQLRIRFAEKINMNEHGVMTYASDNVLDFTNVSDLTATYASNFASTGSHSGTLTMTQAETVPAGEGLFLKGTANETFYVPVLCGITPAALAPANMLVGLTTPTLVPQVNGDYTNFIFAKHGDDFGWYRLAADYTLKAHSAYLPLLTSSVYTGGGAIAITMDFGDGEVTDINKVEADDDANADGDWYTLDGLKLEKKPTKKGVYIKDGRKVVVK